ncbi:MAG: MFS transporter [Oscillospiraceae bacterium]|nr:MFS transporter [Oscillospiraceae bacterium]
MLKLNTIKSQKQANIVLCVILVAAACVVHGVMQGVHDNYGIMMNGLVGTSGISYSYISFCIGVGALVYGVAQPFLGMLALKKSNALVIMLGIAFTVLGLVITPMCRDRFSMLLFFGLVLPFGTTGLCFGIVMGALTPVIGEKRSAVVSGIVQASAGVGDAFMSPALQLAADSFGIHAAMPAAAVPFLLMVPIVVWIGRVNKNNGVVRIENKREISFAEILRDALRERDYRLILIGFATCGFNMSIIESHLFSQYISYGIESSVASLTLTVYGIATMLGAVASGCLCSKFKMKNVLGTLYAMRVIISLGFLLVPKSVPFAFAATALLGACGDATVPPTSGIISKRFGAEKMAVLYGFALIGHQVGAFASSFLGGVFVNCGAGYAPLWAANLCLASIAAGASCMIKEKAKESV